MTGLRVAVGLAAAALAGPCMLSWAQTPAPSARGWASTVCVPQVGSFHMGRGPAADPIAIASVSAEAAIRHQVATTKLEIRLRNPSVARREAELLVPVPEGAVVRSFAYEGQAGEPSARLLPKDEARRTYDQVVSQSRDPGLLEFVGHRLVRTSVFPIEPGKELAVRLEYEHILPADGDRVDYVLPRSESVAYSVPWTIRVAIKSDLPVTAIYSPSHKIATAQPAADSARVELVKEAATVPGPFRLSYLRKAEGVSASLFAYPDPKSGGGYYLLLAGVPAPDRKADAPGIRRELTLVIDRSGSMRGEKLDQVREAAIQVINGLESDETFNIITYNDSVEALSRQPMARTREKLREAEAFLQAMTAQGGTNIHDALVEALSQPSKPRTLPIVLFMTDGLPTVGQTAESVIRDAARTSNREKRRIFTFGVGVDVNTPLLEKIAWESRASTTFILPGEDVEPKVAGVFRRLTGPVLADPELTIGEAGGRRRVRDVLPARLPDLFDGEQVIVMGRYVGEDPLECTLSGNFGGELRRYQFRLGVDGATARNAFVPRLWASRKIALLVDAIREQGGGPAGSAASAGADPRTKELIDEVVRLSTEFGILTEYTAFLAREGTDFGKSETVVAEATKNFTERAIKTRTGVASVNQEINNQDMKWQGCSNPLNRFLCPDGTYSSIATIQQVCDLTYYRRNSRWVDSRLLDRPSDAKPARVVEFGSDEFRELAARLAEQGRPGGIALKGDVLMSVDGEAVLIQADLPNDKH